MRVLPASACSCVQFPEVATPPLRLIFVQMIFIYWMNGLYKLFGAQWRDGESLYWAMSDVALARFAPFSLPIPYFVTQMMTWTVLAWEATFPFLLVYKWTRRPALVLGVLFHLGIFATMVPAWIFLGIILSFVPHDLMYGPQAALIAECFTPRLRYSGCSIGYQLASVIAGGPAPLIATAAPCGPP